MKSIKVMMMPIRDGETVVGSAVIESNRSGSWTKDRSFDMLSSDAKTRERTIILEDHERLVIEAASDTETVYDKEQMMARERPKDPEVRAKLEAEEKSRAEKEAKDTELRRREVQTQNEAKRPATTNLGNPIPERARSADVKGRPEAWPSKGSDK